MAKSKSTSEKYPKQQSTLNKKCCLFSHLCKTKEEELHVCCSFCKKTDCEIRCCDDINDCKYIMTPEEYIKFSFTRGEVDIKEYAKYNKTYPHNKKDLDLIKEYKKENNKKPKTEQKKEIKSSEPVKRGKRKKLTEETINSMTKDQCKQELDELKIRYLYKNTLPELREMLIKAIKTEE